MPHYVKFQTPIHPKTTSSIQIIQTLHGQTGGPTSNTSSPSCCCPGTSPVSNTQKEGHHRLIALSLPHRGLSSPHTEGELSVPPATASEFLPQRCPARWKSPHTEVIFCLTMDMIIWRLMHALPCLALHPEIRSQKDWQDPCTLTA